MSRTITRSATRMIAVLSLTVIAAGSLIRESYSDYDLRLPTGLAVSGLILVAVAIRRIRRTPADHRPA